MALPLLLAASCLVLLSLQPAAAQGRLQRGVLLRSPVSADAPAAIELLVPESAELLALEFAEAGYDLALVRLGLQAVPRLFATQLPRDLRSVDQSDERKEAFLGALLPLVLIANEEILADRALLQRLSGRLAAGDSLTLEERGWLAALAEVYRVEDGDLAELLQRVDALPVSLTLAQAIEESGWGTSRYARDGNALFGQRTWRETVPGLTARKDGQTLDHRAAAFANLMQSVRAYMYNLNTNPAYRKLRDERARLREGGEPIDGAHLAGFLGRYAENATYAENLRRLMRHNELAAFEAAVLASGAVAEVLPAATITVPQRSSD